MSNELEVYTNNKNNQGIEEVKSLELMSEIVGGICSQTFECMPEFSTNENDEAIEKEKLQSELEIKRQENEIRLAEIGLEKNKLREQRKILERLINISLMSYDGKLKSLTRARGEYALFYGKQLSKINAILNNLMLQRDRMDIDGYSKLTPTINRLIESKEKIISDYNISMIKINNQISKLELKLNSNNNDKQKLLETYN